MKAIQTTLVNEFKKNHNDTDFPARAYKQIAEFKGKIGAENKNDPNRLNVRGKYMSQLKMLCIASLARHQVDEHYDADMDKVESAYTSAADRKIAREFDDLKMLEQYTQQRKWSKTKEDGIAGELATVRVIPQILEQLKLTKREAWTARDNTQARMLEHEKIEVDVDAMMAAVLPDLHSAVIPKLALALLLTTGRRTVEIFKTAVFTKVAK